MRVSVHTRRVRRRADVLLRNRCVGPHPPPLHGEHITEILAEYGYDVEEIRRLGDEGVV